LLIDVMAGGRNLRTAGSQTVPAVLAHGRFVPAAPTRRFLRNETAMNPFHQQQPLILVIDDEPTVLGEVAATLSGAGYACHCSSSGPAALQFVAKNTPDLIISDINLDGQNGLELCREIKQSKAMADVPVMFLSGAQIPDIIRRSHAVGGTYYLRKPFDPEVLLELIQKALWMPHLIGNHLDRKATVSAS
jgi:CheY-like chemotaxis protein